MRLTAADLHARGVTLTNHSRFSTARRVLREAAARAETANERARITGTLAYVLTRTGHPEEAERLCREALRAGSAAEPLPPEVAAVLQGQLGLLAVERGDFDDALPWLDHAIAGERDPARLAAMLTNRSVALMRMGRLEQARSDLDNAAERYGLAGSLSDRAVTIHNAGYVALLEGDLITALELMSEARPLAASSPVNAAICDLDRAEVLREAGQLEEAERTLESVARSFGAAGMPQSRAEAEFHLARSLVTHDPAKAAEVAGHAVRRFRRLGSRAWAARAEGLRQRALLSLPSAGRRRPAAEQVRAAEIELEQVGFRTEAQMLRLTHRVSRARRGDLDPTRIRLSPSDPLPVRLLAHEARAVQAGARGRDADVRRHAAAGLESLAAWQRSFGSLDMASSIAMHGNALMLEGLGAAMRSGRPDVLFEWSEQARHFAHQVAPVRPPRDPAHAADLAQLRMLREETGVSWEADARVHELRERIRKRQWATAGEAEAVPRIDLETLRGALGTDTALLSYVYARGQLQCLVVPATGPARIIDIDAGAVRERMPGLRADLDVAAAVGSGPMARIVRVALDARLATLSSLLVEEAMTAAGDPRRVMITAPGILAGLPWTMLPAMRGRSVSLVRSASRWVAARPRVGPGASAGFAVGPGIARGPEEAQAAAFAWEVDAASHGGTHPTVLYGADATVEAVTDLAETVDVLHLVAHGRHSIDAPLLSGLGFSDGALFGYDIDLIDRMPRTVILSACELGRSSVRWGAEALGMAHAWLHAGAVCVIAAPVTVADDIAAELLGALHGGLAAGLAPADALALATTETGLASPFITHGSGF